MQHLKTAGARLAALPAVPALAILCALQLAQAAWFAFETPHNGAIWYSGGDATEYWTEQWSLAHHFIPQPVIGFGLPVYYAWVPLVAGPTLLTGLKVIVAFQAIVLVPLALVFFWLVADRLYGRIYAWIAAALWVAGPLLLLHGFVDRYHPVFEQYFLAPHWFGLTNMGDFPSLVVVLACVWMTLRAVDNGSPTDAVIAGLLGGLLLGLKPANGFVLPAIAVLLIGARRPRIAALWVVSLVPALLTLVLWKVRGYGYLPLSTSSYEKLREAAGPSTPVVAATASKYVQFNWGHLKEELLDLREVFWSLRFLEFLVVAGAFGVIRKNPFKGLFVVVWFAAFGVVKGSSVQADFTSANWFRLAEPGLPAFILLVVGVVYCLPVVGRRTAPVARTIAAQTFDWRRIAVAVTLLGLIPLVVVGTAPPASAQRIVRDDDLANEAPISKAFALQATVRRKSVALSWTSTSAGGVRVFYRVFRSTKNDGCTRPDSGANECLFHMDSIIDVRGTTATVSAGSGTAWYRIGMLAGYRSATDEGDLMLLSEPVRVRVP